MSAVGTKYKLEIVEKKCLSLSIIIKEGGGSSASDALLSCLASIASDPHSPEEEQVNNF